MKEGDDVMVLYRSRHVTCAGPGIFQPYIDDCHDTWICTDDPTTGFDTHVYSDWRATVLN